jgi:hypothetical protein
MNLRKTVLTLMAAAAILLGSAAGVSAQVADSNYGSVTVAANGSFDVYFCAGDFSFAGVTLNSANPVGNTSASINICYTDTLAWRPQFRTYMSAGDFTDFNGHSIPASNVSPKYIYNVLQGQWGVYNGNDIGDIGGMKGAANYSSGPGGYVNGTAGGPDGPWVGGNLSTWQYIGYSWEGVGTGGSQYGTGNGYLDAGSIAPIELKLSVPANTVPGNYYSVFTLQVNLNEAP